MSHSDDPLIGRTIDNRYRIDGIIGRGGMGAVYRARQLGIDRDVAFKVLRGDKQHSRALRRFEAEARIIARLRHPHTVRLIDFGQLDDDLYLVLELIGGHPLDALIGKEAVTPTQGLELCAQVADALTEAHGLGIVHRDLKPGNILVEPIGDRDVARILDFGVARVADNTMTREGSVMGTPAYMAPEQAQGKTATPAADLYALGVILYEVLAGERPFRAENHFGLMMMHINEAPTPIGPMLPTGAPWREAAALVEQLLAKNPSDRPSSAGEVRDRLREIRAEILGPRRVGDSVAEDPPGPGADADMTLMPDDSGDDWFATPGSTEVAPLPEMPGARAFGMASTASLAPARAPARSSPPASDDAGQPPPYDQPLLYSDMAGAALDEPDWTEPALDEVGAGRSADAAVGLEPTATQPVAPHSPGRARVIVGAVAAVAALAVGLLLAMGGPDEPVPTAPGSTAAAPTPAAATAAQPDPALPPTPAAELVETPPAARAAGDRPQTDRTAAAAPAPDAGVAADPPPADAEVRRVRFTY